jgi:hypothetical protein
MTRCVNNYARSVHLQSRGSRYPGVPPSLPPNAWASNTAMSHAVHEPGVIPMVTSSKDANTRLLTAGGRGNSRQSLSLPVNNHSIVFPDAHAKRRSTAAPISLLPCSYFEICPGLILTKSARENSGWSTSAFRVRINKDDHRRELHPCHQVGRRGQVGSQFRARRWRWPQTSMCRKTRSCRYGGWALKSPALRQFVRISLLTLSRSLRILRGVW